MFSETRKIKYTNDYGVVEHPTVSVIPSMNTNVVQKEPAVDPSKRTPSHPITPIYQDRSHQC